MQSRWGLRLQQIHLEGQFSGSQVAFWGGILPSPPRLSIGPPKAASPPRLQLPWLLGTLQLIPGLAGRGVRVPGGIRLSPQVRAEEHWKHQSQRKQGPHVGHLPHGRPGLVFLSRGGFTRFTDLPHLPNA